MPEWAVYLGIGVVLTGILAWCVAGALGAIAAARGTVTVVRRLTAPRDSAVWLPCHHADCGAHMETRHDVTACGLVCSHCHRVAGS